LEEALDLSFDTLLMMIPIRKQVPLWTAGVLRSVTVTTKGVILVDSTAQPVSRSVGICDSFPR